MLDLFLFLLMVLIMLPITVTAVVFCGTIAHYYADKLLNKIRSGEDGEHI